MSEEDPVLPFPDGARRGDQRHDQRQHDVDPAGVRSDDLLVAPHQFVFLDSRDVVAGQSVAYHQVGPEHSEEDRSEHAEQSELHHQQGGEHIVVVHRREPEAVGVDAGQRAQRGQEHHQQNGPTDQPPASPESTRRSGAAGSEVVRGTHGASLISTAARLRAGQRGGESTPRGSVYAGEGATRHRQPECAGG
jgi:hypothetical protein